MKINKIKLMINFLITVMKNPILRKNNIATIMYIAL